jgi:hypothetical protein
MLIDEGLTYYCLNWKLKITYLMYPFLQYHLFDDTKILYITLEIFYFIMKSLFGYFYKKSLNSKVNIMGITTI